MKYLLTAAAIAASLAASGRAANSHSPSVQGGEEYAVYSALLSHRFRGGPGSKLAIVSRTCEAQYAARRLNEDDMKERLSAASPSVLEDFKSKQRGTAPLEGRFKLESEYLLMDEGVWREMFTGDPVKSWEVFEQKYPNSLGIVCLSGVGFNEGVTEALVYVDYECGSTCGGGGFVLLKKQEQVWKVEKVVGVRVL